jgi:hypothetical protein
VTRSNVKAGCVARLNENRMKSAGNRMYRCCWHIDPRGTVLKNDLALNQGYS